MCLFKIKQQDCMVILQKNQLTSHLEEMPMSDSINMAIQKKKVLCCIAS